MTRSSHPYGSDPSQLGELFLPSGTGPFGVVVVVHGGYWKAQYDRSLMTDLCLDLAAHGLAAWNLEYRRIGSGGGWPATLLDVAAGVDLLADLEAPLDLSRVVAVGHSAGGQLALWAASRPDTADRCARCLEVRGTSIAAAVSGGRPAGSHARSRSHAVVDADDVPSAHSASSRHASSESVTLGYAPCHPSARSIAGWTRPTSSASRRRYWQSAPHMTPGQRDLLEVQLE